MINVTSYFDTYSLCIHARYFIKMKVISENNELLDKYLLFDDINKGKL